jgi:nucleoside triphosphate pyrophosphatase
MRPALILASSSPRRRALLAKLGVPFEVLADGGVDEGSVSGAARDVSSALAIRKAEAARERLVRAGAGEEVVILGGDTVVALGEGAEEEILGKPRDAGDARRMIRALSGRSHIVWTGLALARPGHATRSALEATRVTFHPLADAEIEAYVATGDHEGKAGSYGIQGAGASLVAGFEGCYYNVVGLPLVLAARLLAAAGLTVAYACDCACNSLQRGAPGCAGRGVRDHR